MNHIVENCHTTHTHVAEQLFCRNDIENYRDNNGVQTCQKESPYNMRYYEKIRVPNPKTLLSSVILLALHIIGFLDLEDAVAL